MMIFLWKKIEGIIVMRIIPFYFSFMRKKLLLFWRILLCVHGEVGVVIGCSLFFFFFVFWGCVQGGECCFFFPGDGGVLLFLSEHTEEILGFLSSRFKWRGFLETTETSLEDDSTHEQVGSTSVWISCCGSPQNCVCVFFSSSAEFCSKDRSSEWGRGECCWETGIRVRKPSVRQAAWPGVVNEDFVFSVFK
jgi:hypothetical protein